MNNNEQTDEKSTDNGIPTITLNISIATANEKVLQALEILGFDAPIPTLETGDKINLQISIQQEASDES